MLYWNIYEISSHSNVHGIKLRGRIRKFTIENNIVCIVENASDEENKVRFALLENTDPKILTDYIQSIVDGISTTLVIKNIANPVLSKLKVNSIERY